MISKLISSKLMSVTAVLAAAAIILSYSVMTNNQADNTVCYTESAVYLLSGLFLALGICLLNKEKKTAGILTVCAALFLPIFVNPYLKMESENIPYLFQVTIYAKRTMTMVCPFIVSFLIKGLCSITEKRKYGTALMSFGYFAAAFLTAAALQSIMKWQYYFWYDYETTWNSPETFYWVVTINAVYIWYILRTYKFIKENSASYCFIYALTANGAAAAVLIWKSHHIRSILYNFTINHTWLSYRLEIFKGIINGEYTVGLSTYLSKFPEEFPICILWESEPLVSMRLTYGWSAVLAVLAMFVVFIAALCFTKHRSLLSDEICMWIRYSFAALFILSFVSQMFLPAYGLMMPLIGNGACMISMLIVYLALQK